MVQKSAGPFMMQRKCGHIYDARIAVIASLFSLTRAPANATAARATASIKNNSSGKDSNNSKKNNKKNNYPSKAS